jgi:ABC-type dipeptide/oligopeptide/nickel transport system ATPase component
MIINLRGTSGSGKSHCVREIMKMYDTQTEIAYPTTGKIRRKPLGLICARDEQTRHLFIPGHYRIKNGGIDTVDKKTMPYIYELILEHHGLGSDVLYEGQYFTDKLDTLSAWHQAGLDVRVVFFNLSPKDCFTSVRQRGHNIRKETIQRLYDKSLREVDRLAKTDMRYIVATREQALKQIREWLGE